MRSGPESDHVPDGDSPAPAGESPGAGTKVQLAEAHWILGGAERCLPMPDEERALTRREAAESLLLYLGWSEIPYCATSAANR